MYLIRNTVMHLIQNFEAGRDERFRDEQRTVFNICEYERAWQYSKTYLEQKGIIRFDEQKTKQRKQIILDLIQRKEYDQIYQIIDSDKLISIFFEETKHIQKQYVEVNKQIPEQPHFFGVAIDEY